MRQDIEISEIIVADDGSTDSSKKIISELATKHENVIASFREYNVGVSANRDRAIRSATGELITTLDGDDLFLPGKIKAEYEILAKHEFKGSKARYEELNEGHHDHLIDVKTGEIIEFVDDEIEKLQKKVAEKHGYTLVDHKLELYGIKKNPK